MGTQRHGIAFTMAPTAKFCAKEMASYTCLNEELRVMVKEITFTAIPLTKEAPSHLRVDGSFGARGRKVVFP